MPTKIIQNLIAASNKKSQASTPSTQPPSEHGKTRVGLIKEFQSAYKSF